LADSTEVTGIKPTGTPHVGNYLEMIRPALDPAPDQRAFYNDAVILDSSYMAMPTPARRASL
jgi:tryptophanyl-tRNA synthetase